MVRTLAAVPIAVSSSIARSASRSISWTGTSLITAAMSRRVLPSGATGALKPPIFIGMWWGTPGWPVMITSPPLIGASKRSLKVSETRLVAATTLMARENEPTT